MYTITANDQDNRNMAVAGLKTAFRLLEKWGCSPEQQQAILNIPRATYYKYRRNPASANLNSDQIERLSYLINIHAHLRVIFDNPDNLYGFMSMKNHNPFFNGKSPLEVISTGRFGALYETFKQIDSIRGGQEGFVMGRNFGSGR